VSRPRQRLEPRAGPRIRQRLALGERDLPVFRIVQHQHWRRLPAGQAEQIESLAAAESPVEPGQQPVRGAGGKAERTREHARIPRQIGGRGTARSAPRPAAMAIAVAAARDQQAKPQIAAELNRFACRPRKRLALATSD